MSEKIKQDISIGKNLHRLRKRIVVHVANRRVVRRARVAVRARRALGQRRGGPQRTRHDRRQKGAQPSALFQWIQTPLFRWQGLHRSAPAPRI